MKRIGKYSIPGLEKEIDNILKGIEELTGKAVKELPNVSTVSDGAIFHVKQTNQSFDIYKKIDGEYRKMYVDENSLVYWE